MSATSFQDGEVLLRRANSCDDLFTECGLGEIIDSFTNSNGKKISIVWSTSLSVSLKRELFAIFENNMKSCYEEVLGWNPKKKQREMFSNKTVFVIISDIHEGNEKIEGFAQFEFSWDDLDVPDYPVIYTLELQLEEKLRGKGCGKMLVSIMKKACCHFNINKIMLTCFKINTDALQFYEKMGFVIDENSPSSFGLDEPYEILSLLV